MPRFATSRADHCHSNRTRMRSRGRSSMVERQPSKLDVVGSSPIARFLAPRVVEYCRALSCNGFRPIVRHAPLGVQPFSPDPSTPGGSLRGHAGGPRWALPPSTLRRLPDESAYSPRSRVRQGSPRVVRRPGTPRPIPQFCRMPPICPIMDGFAPRFR